ncbi:glycerol-3-phosphate dehydrogenase/oxidase [Laceyella sacchari]|jgi:glycerol-3-phosphate dehydrogenase|uniref:Glycerol-3-phosphate dehydrogenase n=1 Tax=Laceyella sacchari TaxID=37482 RepID=A0ABY5U6S9_LACSH|nr:glycerol-3-phosphate dehydrogenase/oxidase [Laceyella sacchari]TCW34581.1 glycerol-3-phosphate dehydrogenase [Laceyella sacchari]UWE03738.1 glycerol-3-phosphate dehydrogenase/oxidase [Laceyella sacchari]
MINTFSVKSRRHAQQELRGRQVDVLVIGGGITGAGIALDCQSRGLETVLVEMQDFAAGTSGRTTKLIHGGLRYLKQGEFKLVKEVGREREIVYENGPHITIPERVILPVMKGGNFGKYVATLGLTLYDQLAQVKKKERFRWLTKNDLVEQEPLLRAERLMGAGEYIEYRTDDARLTIEVIKKAVRFGAKAFNYMKVEEFLYEQKRIVGVKVRDLLINKVFYWYARKVINATGPWIDKVRKKEGLKHHKKVVLTKGVHLVVPHEKLPLRHPVYVPHVDGRMIFVVPRQAKTYIGTTETVYHGDLAQPRVTRDDRDYLIHAVNEVFSPVRLRGEDIETCWAGVRSLIVEKGKPVSGISRKDELFISPSGLISVTGGKLTGYRKIAQRVTDIVAKEIQQETKRRFRSCFTQYICVSGGEVGGAERFATFVKSKVGIGRRLGLSEWEAETLVRRYGSNVDAVFEWIKKQPKQDKWGLPAHLYASLMYGLEQEMVVSPVDFFTRRIGAMHFEIDLVKKWKKQVTALMGEWFDWDDKKLKAAMEQLEKEIEIATEVI